MRSLATVNRGIDHTTRHVCRWAAECNVHANLRDLTLEVYFSGITMLLVGVCLLWKRRAGLCLCFFVAARPSYLAKMSDLDMEPRSISHICPIHPAGASKPSRFHTGIWTYETLESRCRDWAG